MVLTKASTSVVCCAKLKQRFKGQSLPDTGEEAKTDFTELKTTVNFNNGIASNDDLSLKSPLLRVTGKGSANLVSEELDYGIVASVVATAAGQGGADLQELEGIPVPIRVTGTFAEPKYGLDLETLAKVHAQKLIDEKKGRGRRKKPKKRFKKRLARNLASS